MKKRITFIIGMLMAVLICFTGAMDSKAEVIVSYYDDDGNVEWYIDKDPDRAYCPDTLHVKPSKGSDGIMNDYLDPIAGCIGLYSGWSDKTVTKLEIEEGFVHIGDYAFCSDSIKFHLNQNTVVIPNTVKSIGEGAFARNTELYSVDIPDSVEKIGANAFSSATTIKCNDNSYALEYAKENGYKYIIKDLKIKLNKTSVTTTKGKTVNIKVLNKKDNKIFDGKVDTQVSNSNVLNIKQDGSIEIIGYGKSVIKYTAGSSTAKCTIYSKPLKAKIKAAKSYSKKSVKVKWSAVDDYSGLQIMISQDKNFKKGVKKVIVSNTSKYSFSAKGYVYPDNYTIKGLKSKKIYYVKMRAYAYSGTSKVWGEYSKTLKVRIK